MPVTPVRAAAEQLKTLLQREHRPGDRLPAERELALRLGVERAVVREALVTLEMLGAVEARAGEGWVVTRTDVPLDVPSEHGRIPSDILQARLLVECATIEQAARRHDAAEIAELKDLVESFQAEADRGVVSSPADRRFHLTLARVSGNAVLSDVVAYLWDLQNGRLFQATDAVGGRQRERVQRYAAEHRAMFVHVVAGDADGARHAMRSHLEGVYRDLLDT